MAPEVETFKREAGEHITNMQGGLHVDDSKQNCNFLHGDTARAIIWLIRRVEELFSSPKEDKGVRVVKFWGIEVPLERGLSFRDLIILIAIGYFIYVHILTGMPPQ